MTYDILLVDALAYDNGWIYNETTKCGEFTTNAKNVSNVLTKILRKVYDIHVNRDRLKITYDCATDEYEITQRSDGRPVVLVRPQEI